MANELEHCLEEQLAAFALDSFRPGQREIIATILSGQDCLAIMPTGGGKSLCYQLPALIHQGVTLVVSPLIALMKDQVDSVRESGARATLINSTLDAGQQHERLDEMARGRYDLVYIAPERLRSPRFLDAISQTSVKMLAIDEAHCISQWGHDFRPDYARLGQFRRRLGDPPTIALTATATPAVRDDIIKQLGLRKSRVFITGFARPNLHFEVLHGRSNPEKEEMLLEFLEQTPGAGIIYASTRKRCEQLGELLKVSDPRSVGSYHAGMAADERREIQEAFMRGDCEIIVATNAFGMGINKSDLRFVVHYNMPGSLESYYQEAGRAGRDDQPSRCLLLYSPGDRRIQEFFIENAYPSRETVAHVYLYLCNLMEDPIEVTQHDLKERLSLEVGGEGIGACEQLLERCGAIERLSTQENRAAVRIDADRVSLTELLPSEARSQRRVMQAIEKIVGPRRGERVYFPLTALIQETGMRRDAVNRALRELRKLDAFDYVPPFRGRAIHVPRRDRPFDELPIDFATLEKRKANEFEKLEQMISYARSRSCRQLQILKYFGDPAARRCQACDNCGSTPAIESSDATIHEEEKQLVQCVRIALSGVARAQSRVGKLMVAKMLCGSKSRQVSKLRLDRLSTFGLLAELKQTEAVALLDALSHGNLIQQKETRRMRPVVELTPAGRQVMTGQMRLEQPLSIAKTLKKRLQTITLPHAGDTRCGAKRTGASQPPATAPVPPPPAAARSTADQLTENTAQPDWYWTWKVFSIGCGLAECERIRRLDRSTILDHLLDAAHAGHDVQVSWMLSGPQQAALQSFRGESKEKQASRLAELLDAQQLRILKRCYLQTE